MYTNRGIPGKTGVTCQGNTFE